MNETTKAPGSGRGHTLDPQGVAPVRVVTLVPPRVREEWRAEAELRGISVGALVRQAMRELLSRG